MRLKATPIKVRLLDGAVPKEVILKNRTHQVERVANRWRIHTLWHRPQSFWRDYFRITTKTGLMFTIYHDLLTDLWYKQIRFD